MDKKNKISKGFKLFLCAAAAFLIIVLTVHRVFVDMGLDSTAALSKQTIEYVKSKLEIYDNYMAHLPQDMTEEGKNDLTQENMFEGMVLEHSGVLVVSSGDTVVAMNKGNIQEHPAEFWESLCRNSVAVRDGLGKVEYNGSRWYVSEAKYKEYTIHVLFPANEVYEGYYTFALIIVVVYFVICLMIVAVYTQNERKNYLKLRKSFRTISAISSAYMATLLVQLKDGKSEWVKLQEHIKNVVDGYSNVTEIMDFFAENYVQEPYREDFQRFVDIHTVKERLQGKESIAYTYEDTQNRWVTIAIVPQRKDEDGNLVAILYLVRNVTEAMQKEKEYQKQLRLAGDAKTNFLRRMSHDIRTPINGIQGIVEIAERNPNDMQRQQDCREKVKLASGYLLDLVNNVLDMSKLESGEVKLERKTFQLSDLLNKSNEIIKMQCRECGITYEIMKNEIIHDNLIGSPVHLQQVLMNIAGNAVKYNRENGSIIVSTIEVASTDDRAEVEFTCVDTGIGMSEEFQKHIFEPFSQENESARTKYAGTGLGMAIAKELTELQGGTISLESKEGEGTRFVVRMSFEIDHAAVIRSDEETERLHSIEGLKILLVEDNDLNMEVAAYLLEEKGAVVTKAWNGKEAVETFASAEPGTFNMILMDVMMPIMNGLEASEAIRSLNHPDAKTIPIIAMTANAFQDDVERSIQAGMNAHVTKPLDMNVLLKTIYEVRAE